MSSGDETGWLIEHTETPKWWTGWPGSAFDVEFWTSESANAVRFSRREDAETMAHYALDGECRITQHMWCDPKISAEVPVTPRLGSSTAQRWWAEAIVERGKRKAAERTRDEALAEKDRLERVLRTADAAFLDIQAGSWNSAHGTTNLTVEQFAQRQQVIIRAALSPPNDTPRTSPPLSDEEGGQELSSSQGAQRSKGPTALDPDRTETSGGDDG
jgi:hypothetical protein